MLFSRMIRDHFSVSSFKARIDSSGDKVKASKPFPAKYSFISAVVMTRSMASLRRWITSAGVPRGTTTWYQNPASKPLTPLSAIVGISVANCDRHAENAQLSGACVRQHGRQAEHCNGNVSPQQVVQSRASTPIRGMNQRHPGHG